MADTTDPGGAFIPITDEQGRVTGMMDRMTADYLASTRPDPTQATIDSLLATATRVRVVPVANRFAGTEQRVLLDTADPATVATFRQCFGSVEDPATFGHCMCVGDPHIEVYASDRLAAVLGYHHGFAIRWDAWKHDALLAEPDRLLDWMSAHGVHGPREEVELIERRTREAEQQALRWEQAMPACLRPLWPERLGDLSPDLGAARAALVVGLPDPVERVRALLHWYAAGAGPWSGYPAYESVPDNLLLGESAEALAEALAGTQVTEAHLLGAARYFARWDRSGRRKADCGRCPTDVIRRMADAVEATGILDNIERMRRAFDLSEP